MAKNTEPKTLKNFTCGASTLAALSRLAAHWDTSEAGAIRRAIALADEAVGKVQFEQDNAARALAQASTVAAPADPQATSPVESPRPWTPPAKPSHPANFDQWSKP